MKLITVQCVQALQTSRDYIHAQYTEQEPVLSDPDYYTLSTIGLHLSEQVLKSHIFQMANHQDPVYQKLTQTRSMLQNVRKLYHHKMWNSEGNVTHDSIIHGKKCSFRFVKCNNGGMTASEVAEHTA